MSVLGRPAGRAKLTFAVALVVVSAVFAAWFGWTWRSGSSEAIEFVDAREDVLRVGEEGVSVLNTLDHRNIDAGMDIWLASSTGDLHDTLARTRDDSRARLAAAKSTTSARVLDAAVTELDTVRGLAKLIAAAEISVARDGAQPTVRTRRFQAELTRTDAGWKLSALAVVHSGSR